MSKFLFVASTTAGTMKLPRRLSRIRPLQSLTCIRQVHSKNKRKQFEWRQSQRTRPIDDNRSAKRSLEEFLRRRDDSYRTDAGSLKPLSRSSTQVEAGVPTPPVVQGKSPKAMARARKNAEARVREWEDGPPAPTDIKKQIPKDVFVPIILQEKDIVCVNKPPALLSQPGLPGEGTILDLLRFQRRDLQPLQTVNRLDKNTTGVMVLGRNPETVRRLNHMFQANKVEKNYLALLKPKPGSPLYTPSISTCRVLSLSNSKDTPTPTTQGILSRKTFLEISKLVILQPPTAPHTPTTGYILSFDPTSHSSSLTHFHLLARLDPQEKLLVQFTPLTGKKHQLRLHAAFLLGAPVVGDHRYGYPQDDGALASVRKGDGVYKDGYALHCFRLAGSYKNVMFDVTAGLPTGRWGDVWSDVRSMIEEEGFVERVRGISENAKEVFAMREIQKFREDPETWSKGAKGQIVKQEI